MLEKMNVDYASTNSVESLVDVDSEEDSKDLEDEKIY